MSLEVIAIGSDNIVRLDGLNNAGGATPGSYVNTATVTFTLLDANGNVYGAQSGVAMSSVNSTGRYEGTIPNSVTAGMAVNNKYTIQVTAVAGGLKLYRQLSCIAKYRSEW
jgi:hypothetical protein